MRWLHRLRSLRRNILFRSNVDHELDEELASYVELSADEARASGASPEAAKRQARIELGGVAAVTEGVRSERAGAGLERWWQDLRHAVRALRRSPGYASTAILTLTLGLGANTAVFSVVDAAMLKPLPYAAPEQLVLISQVFRRGTREQTAQIGMTWDQIDRWRAEPQIFASIATYMAQRVRLDGPKGASQAYVSYVSPDMTRMLGVQPRIGRAFLAEDAVPNAGVVLLAEEFWRTDFKADPKVLGKTIALDSRPYTIVGVLPATMRWGVGGGKIAVWLPLDEWTQRQPGGRAFVGAVARLRPGLRLERAKQDVARAIQRAEAEVPADKRYDADLIPFDSRAVFDGTNKTRRAVAALMGAVGFVLLIACANVANLVLTRALGRSREFAVRAALGATRLRLFRQFLVEGFVLVACGGACGLALAVWAATIVPAVVPEQLDLFEANPVITDRRILVFWGLAMAVTGLLCSLIPAIRASRGDALAGLQGSPRVAGTTPTARRLRLALQATQVALTLVLLAGAGLLTASFVRMTQTDAGYDVDRLVSARVSPSKGRYASAGSAAEFFDELLSRVRHVPGFRATFGPAPPNGFAGRFVAFGRDTDVVPSGLLSIYFVPPDYFAVTGISLKTGRSFSDAEASAGAAVAVIDERAATLHWPAQSAIGQRFRYGANDPWITVIGIAGHVKTRWFTLPEGTIQAYVPSRLFPLVSRGRTLLVRTDGDMDQALGTIRSIVKAIDPAAEPEEMSRVVDLYDDVLREPRFFLILITLFAAVAVVTAAVGLYGLVTYAVNQRTREIGVRIALGADLRRVQALVLREALMPVGLGLVGGLVASLWLTRYLSSLLYDITPRDPATLGVVMLLLLAVAAVAAYLPARRATRIDPILTLRAE